MPLPPKKNSAYIIYTALVSQADTKLLKSSPTLASGDFKVSIDGGAFANLATLPTNTPSGVLVKISLSSSEMNGDNISVACIDASGAEWCDQLINIQTSVRNVDDLAYPATSGRSMVVDASGLVDANAVKVGPTGSGTAQTARDIGASVLLSSGTGTGQVKLSSGYVAPNWGDVGNPTTTVDLSGTNIKTDQKVDVNTIKTNPVVNGGTATFPTNATLASTTNITAGTITTTTNLTNAPPDSSGVTTLLSRLTSGRATLLDNLANLDAAISTVISAISGVAAASATAVWAAGTRTLSAFGFSVTVGTNSDKTGYSISGTKTTLDALNDISSANVLTQVNGALDAASTELSSVPTTTGSLRQMIQLLFQYFRNKRTVTATTETLFKENASTSLGTSTISDDGTTFTHGEIG